MSFDGGVTCVRGLRSGLVSSLRVRSTVAGWSTVQAGNTGDGGVRKTMAGAVCPPVHDALLQVLAESAYVLLQSVQSARALWSVLVPYLGLTFLTGDGDRGRVTSLAPPRPRDGAD